MSPKRAKQDGRNEGAARPAGGASPNGLVAANGVGDRSDRREAPRDKKTIVETLSRWTTNPPREPLQLKKTPPKWHPVAPAGGKAPGDTKAQGSTKVPGGAKGN